MTKFALYAWLTIFFRANRRSRQSARQPSSRLWLASLARSATFLVVGRRQMSAVRGRSDVAWWMSKLCVLSSSPSRGRMA